MPIKRRKKTGGRVTDQIIKVYTKRYNLSRKQRLLLATFIVQVALCQTEEARRLLLGVKSFE